MKAGKHMFGRKGAGKHAEKLVEQDAAPATEAVSDSADKTTAEMLYILEEEKLAGDIYEAFFELYGAKIFSNIGASEDKHFDAVLSQATDTADIDTFVFEPAGSYVNPEIQELYDTLFDYGSQSLEAAYEVGVIIETKDITDLKEAAEAAAGTPLETVYENLLAGSYNHLDAFEGMLA